MASDVAITCRTQGDKIILSFGEPYESMDFVAEEAEDLAEMLLDAAMVIRTRRGGDDNG